MGELIRTAVGPITEKVSTLLMLMVPVLVNSVILLVAFWYEGARKELAVQIVIAKI